MVIFHSYVSLPEGRSHIEISRSPMITEEMSPLEIAQDGPGPQNGVLDAQKLLAPGGKHRF